MFRVESALKHVEILSICKLALIKFYFVQIVIKYVFITIFIKCQLEPIMPLNYLEFLLESYIKNSRKMTCILEYLYLGNIEDARDKEKLRAKDFKHILAFVSENRSLTFPSKPEYIPKYKDINYKFIYINNADGANIIQYFEECFEFIEKGINKEEKVLVCSKLGTSRSATAVS